MGIRVCLNILNTWDSHMIYCRFATRAWTDRATTTTDPNGGGRTGARSVNLSPSLAAALRNPGSRPRSRRRRDAAPPKPPSTRSITEADRETRRTWARTSELEQNRQGMWGGAGIRTGREEGGGRELGLQGVGVLDVSFEHLDGVPVRLPHPPPPLPFSSKCRALTATPSLLAATKWSPEPGRPPSAGAGGLRLRWEGGEERGLASGSRAPRGRGGGGVGWVAWGQRWWALRGGREETMRARGRAGREWARACRARRQTGVSTARRVCPRRAWPRSGCVRIPWVWAPVPAPGRLPAQLLFYRCPAVVKVFFFFRGKQPCNGHGRRKSPKAARLSPTTVLK